MFSNPLVSCIMPTRGRGEFARRSIEVFRRQDYEPRELVILDDDDRPSFPDGPRMLWTGGIRYERVRRRLTIGAKRNIAISRSQGTIIAHWDDDDWSAPERLSDQIVRLMQSGYEVAAYDAMLFTDGRSWWRHQCASGNIIGTSLVYRRQYWACSPFKVTCEIGEDHHFVKHAGTRIATADAGDLMYARIHAGNTSAKTPTGKGWTLVAAPDWAKDAA